MNINFQDKNYGSGRRRLRRCNFGFTLVELVLSLAIIVVIGVMSMPLYQSFQVKNDLDLATNVVSQELRRAQLLSQAVDGDSIWGVKIQSGSIVLFKGASYAVRDTTYDEIFDLPASITPSGLSEITFAKMTGLPSSGGTVILTSNTSEIVNIDFSVKGIVSF